MPNVGTTAVESPVRDPGPNLPPPVARELCTETVESVVANGDPLAACRAASGGDTRCAAATAASIGDTSLVEPREPGEPPEISAAPQGPPSTGYVSCPGASSVAGKPRLADVGDRFRMPVSHVPTPYSFSASQPKAWHDRW